VANKKKKVAGNARMAIARFIDGKLAGYQFAKQDVIDATTDKYPFVLIDENGKEKNPSNPYAWARRWATHGDEYDPPQERTVEVIEYKEFMETEYEKYEAPKVPTVEERLTDLESRVAALEKPKAK